MPKEMKIRLAANVIAIVLAFVNAGYSAWYISLVMNQVIQAFYVTLLVVLMSIFSVTGAALYFLMAKIMWALQKKTKQRGKIVLVIVAVLGIVGGIFPVVTASPVDLTTAAAWSVGIGLTSAGGGFMIVAGRMIGEMIEKLKKLTYFGFACVAALVVLIILANSFTNYSKAVQVAGLGAMLVTITCIIVTTLGYWAESVLIKKKFLVYS